MKTEAGENRGGTNEMKKIMIMAAAAIAVLAGCNKGMETFSSEESITFEKGQTVTLNVIAGDPETRVGSQLDSTLGDVYFRWQAGDSIKVKVGVDSAVFTITSFSADSTVGTFTGRMPAGDSIFSVQYPYTEPVLTNQTYSSTEPIPHDMMKFSADSCSLASPSFTLKPQYAALRLNFYGYDRKVSKIFVRNTSNLDTYTLNVETLVKVGKTLAEATPFFIVVDSDMTAFSVAVTTEEVSPAVDNTVLYEENGYSGLGTVITNGYFATSSTQTFTAGGILNMPAKCITTVWAPVNCGYDATHTYGLLYQWGRKYGQAYEAGTITPTSMSKSDDTEENKDKFAAKDSSTNNWFSGIDNTLWVEGSKGTSDPCPTGWRVPTKSEMKFILDGQQHSSWATNTVGGVSQGGLWFSGRDTGYSETVPQVFFPVAGKRYANGVPADRHRWGYGGYWTSTPGEDDQAWSGYIIGSNYFGVKNEDPRTYGFYVRCVQE